MVLDVLSNVLGVFNVGNPVLFIISLIISTLVGGVVFLVVVELIAKKFRESVSVKNAFLVVLVINIINFLGVLYLVPYISILPAYILQIIIWIVLTKVFFRGMATSHVILAGIIGWILAAFIVPQLIFYVNQFIRF